ncbi:MAG: ATP synthase F1 subunit delta [Chitinophagaceae bacterium]|nr:MAG: ATP synthase F1 subunit delta [Chitinophagaceae bacterium]
MNNPRLASRYAKSLLGLAVEQGKLEEVYADIKFLKNLGAGNPDFIAVLRSPVIAADKKGKIIHAVINGRVSILTAAFINLLVKKARESNMPEIVGAFIAQYNEMKGIHQVKVTTAAPISKEMENEIVAKVKSNPGFQNIELQTLVDESLIGGYKFEMGDVLIDASILRDLNDVRKQFRSNEYIHRIR